jgi:hypothetical protein
MFVVAMGGWGGSSARLARPADDYGTYVVVPCVTLVEWRCSSVVRLHVGGSIYTRVFFSTTFIGVLDINTYAIRTLSLSLHLTVISPSFNVSFQIHLGDVNAYLC